MVVNRSKTTHHSSGGDCGEIELSFCSLKETASGPCTNGGSNESGGIDFREMGFPDCLKARSKSETLRTRQ